MNILAIVLTSAVASAGVTSLFALYGQKLERDSRRKELLFMKCIELAKAKTDFMIELAKATSRPTQIPEYVLYAESYYWLLNHLHEHGRLPENWRNELLKRFPINKE